MQCFNWTSKSRKCAICDNKVLDYIRYNVLDDDPEGILCQSAKLAIRLKDIDISKRNRVVCEKCYLNVEKLCIFKNRIKFVNNPVITHGLLIQSMCSICYDYNPFNMSGTFNDLISNNQCLINYTFEIDFSNIVNDMKLICEDCMRYLYLFCKMHINLQRVHPQKNSMVVDVTESSSSIGRRLSSVFLCCSNTTLDGLHSEALKDLDNKGFPKSGPSDSLRRIPSIPQNLDCLQSLYQQDSVMESDSVTNPYFLDGINFDAQERQSVNNSSVGKLSETSKYCSTLEIDSTTADASAGPSKIAGEQQQAATGQQGNRAAKLKRFFSNKRKNSNLPQTDDQNKKSEKPAKANKRKAKANKRKAKDKKIAVMPKIN